MERSRGSTRRTSASNSVRSGSSGFPWIGKDVPPHITRPIERIGWLLVEVGKMRRTPDRHDLLEKRNKERSARSRLAAGTACSVRTNMKSEQLLLTRYRKP